MREVIGAFARRRRRKLGGAAFVVEDRFTRANSAVTLGTSTSGHAWTAHSGTWGISSNRAYLATPTAAVDEATVESGIADGNVQATAAVLGDAGDYWGLTYRLSDASNYLDVVAVVTGTTLVIQKVEAGSSSNLASDGLFTLQAADVVRVNLNGNAITVYVNDVEELSTTSAFNATATKHGLAAFIAGADGYRWDDFLVTA